MLFYEEFLGLLLAQCQLLIAGVSRLTDFLLLLHYTRQLCDFLLRSW